MIGVYPIIFFNSHEALAIVMTLGGEASAWRVQLLMQRCACRISPATSAGQANYPL